MIQPALDNKNVCYENPISYRYEELVGDNLIRMFRTGRVENYRHDYIGISQMPFETTFNGAK